MDKKFLKAFFKYNWPALLWLIVCIVNISEFSDIKPFDDQMRVSLALDELRQSLLAIKWSYAANLSAVWMFLTLPKVLKASDEATKEKR